MRNIGLQYSERDRLLELYPQADGEERIKILARLVVLDEEGEKFEPTARCKNKSHRQR